MFGRTSFLKATALALPFSLAAAAAHAASIADTVQQNAQLSTLAKAIEAAGLGDQLSGEGPYTLFAPSDQAFEQLPAGALDELMKEDNRAQLTKLLEHHVVEGKAIAADDVLGQQTRVDTMSGDTLTVDGTSQAVLLVPTGLTIARVGDRLVIEREGMAVAAPAIEVEGAAAQTQEQQQGAAETPVTQGSDMPVTEHQQQVLQSHPGQEQRQTAPEGSAMPSTEHQREVLTQGEQPDQQRAQQQQTQQQQAQQQAQGQTQAGAETPVTQGSDMPVTEHQQQVLQSQPGQEQRQTAPEGSAMPSTEHQREVLTGGEQQAQPQTQQQQAQGQAQDQGQAQGRQQQAQGQMQAGTETPVTQGSDMPVTEHQQQVLQSQPREEQRQTAPEGTAMPSTEHQRQALAGGEQPDAAQAPGQRQSEVLREATVVEADIRADNGVIHVIDAVLVPQDVLKMLEASKQGQG